MTITHIRSPSPTASSAPSVRTSAAGSAYADARKAFRVRFDRDPHERAAEEGIRGYDRIVPARRAVPSDGPAVALKHEPMASG